MINDSHIHTSNGTHTISRSATTPATEPTKGSTGTAKPEFDAEEYLNRLLCYRSDLSFQNRCVVDSASRLRSHLETAAVKSAKNGKGEDFRLPTKPTSHFESLAREIFDCVGNVCDEGSEPFVAVPVSVARYALAGIIEAIARTQQVKEDPIWYFAEGDFSAIDLTTEAGKNYLAFHFFQAMGTSTTKEEFEEFAEYCAANREIVFLDDDSEVEK